MHWYRDGRYSTESKEDLDACGVTAGEVVRYAEASQMAPGIHTEQP